MIIFINIIISLILGALLWRALCTFFIVPWPYFLAFWLENPYMKLFANPNKFIEYARPKPGTHILEVGSGAGRILLRVAKFTNFSAKLTGIELQKKMIEHCERNFKKMKMEAPSDKAHLPTFLNERFSHETLKRNPSLRKKFDQVYLVTVLGEVPERVEFLAALRETLAPGGSIFIQEVIPDPCYVFSKKLRKYAASAGLKVISIQHGTFNYIAELK